MAQTTHERIIALIDTNFGTAIAQKAQPDALLGADLTLDSLDLIELTMAIEDEFGIRIEDDAEALLKHETKVADVVNHVDAMLGNAQPAGAAAGGAQ